MTYYLRNPDVGVLARGDWGALIDSAGNVHLLSCLPADELSNLLTQVHAPLERTRLESFAEPETIDTLVKLGILLEGSESALQECLAALRAPQTRELQRLVVAITGTIAAAMMPNTLLYLRNSIADHVDVLMTKSATRFLSPDVAQWLGCTVWCDEFEHRFETSVPHIHLAEQADALLVMPASAHTLHRLAHGACSDLVSLTVAATRAPVICVPAMNSAMWTSPAVRRNVSQLREDGIFVVEPGCGHEIAHGRDADPTAAGTGLDRQTLRCALQVATRNHRS